MKKGEDVIIRNIEFVCKSENFDEWLEASMSVGESLKDFYKENDTVVIVAAAAYISHETNQTTGEVEDKCCFSFETEDSRVVSSIAGAIFDIAPALINLINKHGKIRCRVIERKGSAGDWFALVPMRE